MKFKKNPFTFHHLRHNSQVRILIFHSYVIQLPSSYFASKHHPSGPSIKNLHLYVPFSLNS